MSRCACSSVTPGFRRPSALIQKTPGCSASSLTPGTSGVQSSTPAGYAKPSGITPTTVNGSRSSTSEAADDARVRREAVAPQLVGQHDDARRATAVLLLAERAAECRRHTEHVEEAPRDEPAHELDRLATAAERPGLVRARHAGHVLEGRVGGAPVAERRIGHLDERLPALAVALPDERQPLRLGIGQRPQDHRVRDAEEGGGAPDPHRERCRSDQREAGALLQTSYRVCQVLSESAHRVPCRHFIGLAQPS